MRINYVPVSLLLATVVGAGVVSSACASAGPEFDEGTAGTPPLDESIGRAQEGLAIGANVFYDGFDGGSLNRGSWNVQSSNVNDACSSAGTPFNGEVQRYQDREGCSLSDHNICVSNGSLKLVVRRQDGSACNGTYTKYTSARINSKRKREFNPWTGGAGVRVEAKIRMPAGIAGGWPAFWTLGNDIKQGPRQWNGSDDNDWPDSGEIDIAEAGWNWGGGGTSLNTLHYSSNNWSAWDGDGHQQRSAGSTGIGRYEWHTYAVEWTPSSMTWFKDGGVTGSTSLNFSGQDFEHDHFILLNLAMGGAGGGAANAADSYFPKNGTSYTWEQVMEIDYVRVDRLENSSGGGSCNVGTTVSLKANANGLYSSARGDVTGAPVRAMGPSAGTWERFDIVDAGGGYVALRSRTNNLYVQADMNDANKILKAAGPSVGAWEKFQFVSAGNGWYGLKSAANGLYVSADLSVANAPLEAKYATTIGGWEQFQCAL
jgi:beta-glucanase (GH16 family)